MSASISKFVSYYNSFLATQSVPKSTTALIEASTKRIVTETATEKTNQGLSDTAIGLIVTSSLLLISMFVFIVVFVCQSSNRVRPFDAYDNDIEIHCCGIHFHVC